MGCSAVAQTVLSGTQGYRCAAPLKSTQGYYRVLLPCLFGECAMAALAAANAVVRLPVPARACQRACARAREYVGARARACVRAWVCVCASVRDRARACERARSRTRVCARACERVRAYDGAIHWVTAPSGRSVTAVTVCATDPTTCTHTRARTRTHTYARARAHTHAHTLADTLHRDATRSMRRCSAAAGDSVATRGGD
jgi:hypothetical protein